MLVCIKVRSSSKLLTRTFDIFLLCCQLHNSSEINIPQAVYTNELEYVIVDSDPLVVTFGMMLTVFTLWHLVLEDSDGIETNSRRDKERIHLTKVQWQLLNFVYLQYNTKNTPLLDNEYIPPEPTELA